MTSDREVAIWKPNQPIEIAADANANTIASHARALSQRDITSIASAFNSGSFEMVSTFVWTRAITGLKKQLGELGMEFVGQMLGRDDIDEDSDPKSSLSEHDAVELAENLGMITTTEALRLKQAQQLVAHFADPEIASQEQMAKHEAEGILRSCVVSILGNPHIKPPIQFAELREALEAESLQSDDLRVEQIVESPHFIQRTVLSVLLSLLRTAKGAALEHAVGNTNVIVPLIWNKLRKPDKWQIGQTYAVIHSEGRKKAATGLKHALATVKGFDFVPETLRSDTFAKVANSVIEAHFGWENFYNEPKPMRELASLGTTIPLPAFPICMRAVLCVRLGNYYNVARGAQTPAFELLSALRKEQWEYYLNECLATDETILDKLIVENPAYKWIGLCNEFELHEKSITDEFVLKLVQSDDTRKVRKFARKIRKSID